MSGQTHQRKACKHLCTHTQQHGMAHLRGHPLDLVGLLDQAVGQQLAPQVRQVRAAHLRGVLTAETHGRHHLLAHHLTVRECVEWM